MSKFQKRIAVISLMVMVCAVMAATSAFAIGISFTKFTKERMYDIYQFSIDAQDVVMEADNVGEGIQRATFVIECFDTNGQKLGAITHEIRKPFADSNATRFATILLNTDHGANLAKINVIKATAIRGGKEVNLIQYGLIPQESKAKNPVIVAVNGSTETFEEKIDKSNAANGIKMAKMSNGSNNRSLGSPAQQPAQAASQPSNDGMTTGTFCGYEVGDVEHICIQTAKGKMDFYPADSLDTAKLEKLRKGTPVKFAYTAKNGGKMLTKFEVDSTATPGAAPVSDQRPQAIFRGVDGGDTIWVNLELNGKVAEVPVAAGFPYVKWLKVKQGVRVYYETVKKNGKDYITKLEMVK